MGTATRYPQQVPRQKYEPPNPEVAARIAQTVELYRRLAELETEAKAALAVNVEQDKVPVKYLAEQLDVERKTVYRHLGRSMT